MEVVFTLPHFSCSLCFWNDPLGVQRPPQQFHIHSWSIKDRWQPALEAPDFLHPFFFISLAAMAEKKKVAYDPIPAAVWANAAESNLGCCCCPHFSSQYKEGLHWFLWVYGLVAFEAFEGHNSPENNSAVFHIIHSIKMGQPLNPLYICYQEVVSITISSNNTLKTP